MRDSSLESIPFVVHQDRRVLDCNTLARERKITVGMPLPEAKAILERGRFLPMVEAEFKKPQEEWLDLCTRYSDVIEPDCAHAAWIDLTRHPDAEHLALKLGREIGENIQLPVQIGLGRSKWIAKLACRRLSEERDLASVLRLREAVTQPAAFLESIHVRYLEPVCEEHRQRLEFLGYRRIGDVANVPLEVLHSQFGDSSAHIQSSAKGGYFEPVQAMFPPNSVSSQLTFEGGVEDSLTLDRGLGKLAKSISGKLSSEDMQSKHVVLTLEHEEFRSTVLRRCFSKPITNYASALASLRLLLTRPPSEAVFALRVRLDKVTRSVRVQRRLEGSVPGENREFAAKEAFYQVRHVFGDSAVLAGSELVEPRRKRVLRAWKDATGWY